jgi:two-component system, OmpR family, heavy metal sensor histidine kinase CusS
MRPPWSIALRLTAWYALLSLGAVLLAVGLLDWLLARGLEQDDDDFLADRIRILRVVLAQGPDGIRDAKEEVERESLGLRDELIYVRILDAGGHVVVETPRMSKLIPRALFSGVEISAEDSIRPSDMRSKTGKPFRGAAGNAPGGVIQVAMDRERESALIARYRTQSWWIASVALIAFPVIGHRIARRGIRPVEHIAQDAARVRSTSLHERISTESLPKELLALGMTLNGMLDRIEEAFSRLSQFSADIAHELRTPVSNLRGEMEVALTLPRSPEEYQNTLGSCLEDCNRIAGLIDSLLFLARCETPEVHIVREPVAVHRELQNIGDFYEALSAEAGVTLVLEAPPDLHADLDRTLFQRALGNLVENAIAHTPSGGTVSIHASRCNGSLRIAVSDTGSGIAPQHLPLVFERFYRVDPSRSSPAGATGLGLAIVRRIALLHGGQAAIESTLGCGTRVTLTFPA